MSKMILGVLAIVCSIIAAARGSEWICYPYMKIKGYHVGSERTTLGTLEDCQIRCSQVADCKSIEYNAVTEKCHLNSVTAAAAPQESIIRDNKFGTMDWQYCTAKKGCNAYMEEVLCKANDCYWSEHKDYDYMAAYNADAGFESYLLSEYNYQPVCVEDRSMCDDKMFFRCTTDLFECSNGRATVDPTLICDGDDDCGDCSDEQADGCSRPCDATRNPLIDELMNWTSGEPPFPEAELETMTDAELVAAVDLYPRLAAKSKLIAGIDNWTSGNHPDSVAKLWRMTDAELGDVVDLYPGLAETLESFDFRTGEAIVTTKPDLFECSNGRILDHSYYICNGDDDCGDCSDEQACPADVNIRFRHCG